jgi:predicted nucleotidyltransferase
MDRRKIKIPKSRLAKYCSKWKITELSLFGSVLRDDFNQTSDIDVLVVFTANAHWSLFDLVTAQTELGQILGRPVDLVERRAVERSENYIRRRHILDSAETVYVAR